MKLLKVSVVAVVVLLGNSVSYAADQLGPAKSPEEVLKSGINCPRVLAEMNKPANPSAPAASSATAAPASANIAN